MSYITTVTISQNGKALTASETDYLICELKTFTGDNHQKWNLDFRSLEQQHIVCVHDGFVPNKSRVKLYLSLDNGNNVRTNDLDPSIISEYWTLIPASSNPKEVYIKNSISNQEKPYFLGADFNRNTAVMQQCEESSAEVWTLEFELK